MSVFDLLQDRQKALDILRRITTEQLLADPEFETEVKTLLDSIDKRDTDRAEAASQKAHRKELRRKHSRATNGKFEISGKHDLGINWSTEGIVLARKGKGDSLVRLVWRYGHTAYVDRVTRMKYCPPEMWLLRDSYRTSTDITNHLNKQQLSKALIQTAYREKIDAVFGEGATDRVCRLRATCIF